MASCSAPMSFDLVATLGRSLPEGSDPALGLARLDTSRLQDNRPGIWINGTAEDEPLPC